MKKTLIIVGHPNIENSVINKRWIEELKKYPEKFTVHELYKTYPDGKINITKEQQLIDEHSNLILQFPIQWYSYTPLLKQWLDDVFAYGWAYGSKGQKLKNKKMALAISIGSGEDDFIKPFTVDAAFICFEMLVKYVKADYKGKFTLYGAVADPNRATITTEQIEQSAKDYIQFLDEI